MKKPIKPDKAVEVDAMNDDVIVIPIEKLNDFVNHPAHYETGKYECIDVMREVFGKDMLIDYCILNAFKYLWRCKRKGKMTEDVKKAIWYLNKYIELTEEGVTNG